MKKFDAVLRAMMELETALQEREAFWQATQIKVLRGVVAAIMVGYQTK